MPKLSLWNNRKGATYRTMDKWIAQMYTIGGTSVFIHKYVGPVTTNDENQLIPNLTEATELSIQDIFFLENRDRKYDDSVYEARAIYQVNDQDFDLQQFGIFLPNDVTYLSFHLNDIIDILGRKLMSGDVIEMPHLRDEHSLDPNRPAINRFFVVSDVNRETVGIAPTWWYHTLRVKVDPLTDSQEYADLLDREAEYFNDGFGTGGEGTAGSTGHDGFGVGGTGRLEGNTNTVSGGLDIDDGFGATGSNTPGNTSSGTPLTLRDIIIGNVNNINISDAVADQAAKDVPDTNFETAHLYIAPDENGNWTDPWIWAGDGKPPNGAELLGSGNNFPADAEAGVWFLRTDYTPNVLFRKIGNCWVRQEVDYRRKWKTASRVLETFINNNKDVTYSDGTVHKEKVALSKAVKPKTDKL